MSAYFDVLLHVSNDVPQGAVFMAKHLLHVADRGILDDLLPKFARHRHGPIRRVARGLYFRPYRLMPDTLPTLDHVVRVRAEAYGETLEIHGADAARQFGIDVEPSPHPREKRHEPVAARYYTGGRTRTLAIGGAKVRLQHVPDTILTFPGTAAGRALAAIHHLGPSGVATIHRQLGDEERDRIRGVVRRLPHPILVAWRQADRALPMPVPERRAPFDPEAERRRRVAARRRRSNAPGP